ncbi:MAG: nucleotidyltransferase family protein [Candidatus Sumerlaeota bacterium]|nr:nucleotidyltransferase family protein [Candidatus Sumerlaeota bacterium]
MKSSDIIELLTAHRRELTESYNVRSLELFGSVVRGDATSDSDVDLLVEFDRPVSLFHLFRAQHRLEEILKVPKVDLIMRDSIRPALRTRITGEAVHVV